MKTMILISNTGYGGANFELLTEVQKQSKNTIEEISIASIDVTNEVVNANTAIHSSTEIYTFQEGVLIATTIENADKILNCPTGSIKVLFLYDLDWMFEPINYETIYDTLNNKLLFKIVRSESHKLAIEKSFNTNVDAILPTFELEKIWTLLESIKIK